MELNEEGYLSDPEGIFNLDESALFLGHDYNVIYARRGSKRVLSHHDGDTKERVTVLACENAAGKMLRPFIIYNGMSQISSRFSGPDDGRYSDVNKSGWMDNPSFTAYVREEVIPPMTAVKVIL